MGVLTLLLFREYLISGEGSMLMGQDTIAAGIMFRKFFVEHIRALGRLPCGTRICLEAYRRSKQEVGTFSTRHRPSFPAATDERSGVETDSPCLSRRRVHVSGGQGIRDSPAGALFAGCAYLLSANLVSLVWGGQDGKMYVTALFPGALWLLVTALNRQSWVRFIWLGVVAGLMVVAHPQLAYYAYLTLAVYAIGSLWMLRHRVGRFLSHGLAGGMVSVVTAAGIAAVVLLPMYRYLREDSPRAGPGRGFEYSASWSLHAEEAASLFVPDFSGTDVQAQTYWGKNPFKHNSEYGGALVLVLGISALAGLKGDRRRWGLGAVAGVSLLYALGAGTPVFKLLYSVVPGLKNFRAPSLATYLAIAALTLLSAMLIERVVVAGDLRARRAMSLGLAIGAGAALLLAVLTLAAGPVSTPCGHRCSVAPRRRTRRQPSQRTCPDSLPGLHRCPPLRGCLGLRLSVEPRQPQGNHVVLAITALTVAISCGWTIATSRWFGTTTSFPRIPASTPFEQDWPLGSGC